MSVRCCRCVPNECWKVIFFIMALILHSFFVEFLFLFSVLMQKKPGRVMFCFVVKEEFEFFFTPLLLVFLFMW